MTFVLLPNAGQSLGQTRADIRENFNIIQDSFGRNHVGLNDGTPGNRGKHNFCTFVAQGSTPTPRIAGESYLFSRTFNGVEELAFCPNVVGNVYQLTRTIAASTASFAQATGWTFLPGGLLLQYGTGVSTGATTAVVFPVTFTTLYSITLSRRSTSSTYGYSSPSTTGFDFVSDSPSVGVNFGWMAIGV